MSSKSGDTSEDDTSMNLSSGGSDLSRKSRGKGPKSRTKFWCLQDYAAEEDYTPIRGGRDKSGGNLFSSSRRRAQEPVSFCTFFSVRRWPHHSALHIYPQSDRLLRSSVVDTGFQTTPTTPVSGAELSARRARKESDGVDKKTVDAQTALENAQKKLRSAKTKAAKAEAAKAKATKDAAAKASAAERASKEAAAAEADAEKAKVEKEAAEKTARTANETAIFAAGPDSRTPGRQEQKDLARNENKVKTMATAMPLSFEVEHVNGELFGHIAGTPDASLPTRDGSKNPRQQGKFKADTRTEGQQQQRLLHRRWHRRTGDVRRPGRLQMREHVRE